MKLFVFFFFICQLFSQNDSISFHNEVLNIYSFSPSSISSSEKDLKSSELDKFWEKVKTNKEALIPFLRNELSNFENSPFFLYDGSMLLSSLSKDTFDISIVLNAFPKTDLKDISHYYYLETVNRFASKGFDVSDGAFRILDYPEFTAYVYRHGNLKLDQEMAMFFAFVPMEEEYYLHKLIKRSKVEENDTTMKSIITALWLTVTEEADRVITEIKSDPNQSEFVKNHIAELEKRNEDYKPGFFSFLFSSNVNKLKKERRKLMNRISDEVLYEFYPLSIDIRKAYYRSKE